jgi:hypothetical protein
MAVASVLGRNYADGQITDGVRRWIASHLVHDEFTG